MHSREGFAGRVARRRRAPSSVAREQLGFPLVAARILLVGVGSIASCLSSPAGSLVGSAGRSLALRRRRDSRWPWAAFAQFLPGNVLGNESRLLPSAVSDHTPRLLFSTAVIALRNVRAQDALYWNSGCEPLPRGTSRTSSDRTHDVGRSSRSSRLRRSHRGSQVPRSAPIKSTLIRHAHVAQCHLPTPPAIRRSPRGGAWAGQAPPERPPRRRRSRRCGPRGPRG